MTREKLIEVLRFDPEQGRFFYIKRRSQQDAGNMAGTAVWTGHRRIRLFRHDYMEHHLVWLWAHGELPPKGMTVDHINRNPSDNRPENLRLANRSQQNINQSGSRGKSGIRGVRQIPNGKWTACIYVKGKEKHLGCFKTADEASKAYTLAILEVHGQFAPVYSSWAGLDAK